MLPSKKHDVIALMFWQVRRLNLYKEGDLTPFNQCLEQFTIDRCWKECLEISNYHQRKADVEKFNK